MLTECMREPRASIQVALRGLVAEVVWWTLALGKTIHPSLKPIPTPSHLTQLNSHQPSITPNSIWQCLSTNEWINKMWSTQTVEYYLTTNRNEVLTRAAAWSLNQYAKWSSQNQTVIYYMIPSIWNVQKRWIHRDRKIGGCLPLKGLGEMESDC